jgi:hypothetical protein
VKRIVYVAAVLGLLTACEASTDPIDGVGGNGPGGGAITQAQATGDWSFVLDRQTATCPAGSLPDNQVILAHLDVFSNGTLTTVSSTWQAPPSGAVRTLDGGISFTSGVATLALRGTAANTAMQLSGTFTAGGNFSGTVSDPRAGSFPVFSSGSCSYSATGVKG